MVKMLKVHKALPTTLVVDFYFAEVRLELLMTSCFSIMQLMDRLR